jgi:hypothetical protein
MSHRNPVRRAGTHHDLLVHDFPGRRTGLDPRLTRLQHDALRPRAVPGRLVYGAFVLAVTAAAHPARTRRANPLHELDTAVDGGLGVNKLMFGLYNHLLRHRAIGRPRAVLRARRGLHHDPSHYGSANRRRGDFPVIRSCSSRCRGSRRHWQRRRSRPRKRPQHRKSLTS